MPLLSLLLLGFITGLGLLVLHTMRSLSRPPRRTAAWAIARSRPADPSELPTPRRFETIAFKHNALESGPVWLIEGDDPAGPVCIFCHGWGESKLDVLPRIDALAPVCSRIIAWDMPGHGEAPPGRTLLGTSEWIQLDDLVQLAQGEDLEARSRIADEMEAAIEDEADWETFFNAPPKPGAPKIVLYGYSLGAGVAIELAGDRPNRIAAVIAESPYRLAHTPARNMLILKRLPWRFNLPPAMFLIGLFAHRGPRWTGFDRALLARDLKCPLLVLHGDHDEISPPEDGRAIAEAAGTGREPPHTPCIGTLVTLPDAGHFDLWHDPALVPARDIATDAIRNFIQRIR